MGLTGDGKRERSAMQDEMIRVVAHLIEELSRKTVREELSTLGISGVSQMQFSETASPETPSMPEMGTPEIVQPPEFNATQFTTEIPQDSLPESSVQVQVPEIDVPDFSFPVQESFRVDPADYESPELPEFDPPEFVSPEAFQEPRMPLPGPVDPILVEPPSFSTTEIPSPEIPKLDPVVIPDVPEFASFEAEPIKPDPIPPAKPQMRVEIEPAKWEGNAPDLQGPFSIEDPIGFQADTQRKQDEIRAYDNTQDMTTETIRQMAEQSRKNGEIQQRIMERMIQDMRNDYERLEQIESYLERSRPGSY